MIHDETLSQEYRTPLLRFFPNEFSNRLFDGMFDFPAEFLVSLRRIDSEVTHKRLARTRILDEGDFFFDIRLLGCDLARRVPRPP